jgi:hypothetical protein
MTAADTTRCVVCDSQFTYFATGRVLDKYDVDYQLCSGCGLLALPSPFWLDEAYEQAIYVGDASLLRRSRRLALATSVLIRSEGLRDGRFLDWGGGYGTFARMMRDKGFDFYTTDAYAQNVLAPSFDGDEKESYDLVTAFEVMEHLVDPYADLLEVSKSNDRLFFTTQLLPETIPPPGNWWYYAEGSGQHIAFHTKKSLQILGERLGYKVSSNGDNYHLFHRGSTKAATKLLVSGKFGQVKRAGMKVSQQLRLRATPR